MFGYLKSGVKDSVIYGFGSIAVKLSGFILIPLYTKYFSVSEYGLLGFLEATSTVVISIFGLSLFQAFFVWYWDKEYSGKQDRLFFTTLSGLLAIVVVLFIITMVFAQPLSALLFDSPKYNRLLIFMISASGLQILINIPAKLLQLQQKAMKYTGANMLMLLVNLSLTILFIVFFRFGLVSIYIAQTIGGLVYLLFLSPFIFKNLSYNFDWNAFKSMLAFVLPLIISSIAALIISVSDRYILRYVSGYEKLGLYSFGAKLANTVNVLLVGPIQLAIYPILVRIFNSEQKQRFYSKVLTYLSFILILCILFFSFFSQEIVKVLSQRMEYWDSYKVIPILSFAAVFMMMKDLASLHLQLLKRTKILSIVVVTISLLNIGFNILLIPLFSYMGAAFSFLISQVLYFTALHFFANKPVLIGYEYRKIITMLTISGILVLLTFWLADYPLIVRLSVKTVLFLSFPFLLYPFGFYESIELKRISQIWGIYRNPRNWKKNLRRVSQHEQ
jgi:O-antigen/teichoic acid export membrane protein